MTRKWTTGLITAATLLLAGSPALADGGRPTVRESIQVANHYMFGTDIEVNGATILVRDFKNKIVTATVMTGALEPDFAYSIWWVIFNRPQFCIIPFACSGADLEINNGDPRVKASVFWGGGILADGTGSGTTVMNLVPGKHSREPFAESRDWGLRDIRKAEIHVVLRSHGLAGIAGPVAQQIGTASEACPDPMCTNEFSSIHIP